MLPFSSQIKNVSERDDDDLDIWGISITASAKRRPRPNIDSKPSTVRQKVGVELGKQRQVVRCEPNDISTSLCEIPYSSRLYMWGRHRRIRLPASLRMCFPSPKVHFCPPGAKRAEASVYYNKYRMQSTGVHEALFPISEFKDSTESSEDSAYLSSNFDVEESTSLELLRSLPRSQAARLIIDECDAPPETVKLFLQLLDSTELMIGLHADQATEPMIDICLALEIPFAVVPCCIFSNLFTNRATKTGEPAISDYDAYIQYLCNKDPRIKTDRLSCPGRNLVLYFVPHSAVQNDVRATRMSQNNEYGSQYDVVGNKDA